MVIHIIPSYLPETGGAEVQLSRLANIQVSRNNSLQILTRQASKGRFKDDWYVTRLNRNMFVFNVEVFFKLLINLKSIKAVHVHTLSSVAFTCLIFSRLFKKKVLLKVTRIGEGSQIYLINGSRFKRILFNNLLTRYTTIIALNTESLEYISSNFGSVRCIIVPNGIIPRSLEKDKDDILNCVFISRLIERKNVLETLKLLSELIDINELDYRYILVGSGPEFEAIQHFLKTSKLRVEMKGHCIEETIENILDKSHYFIQNSKNEGLSNSFLEALNSNVIPVVNPSQFYDELRKSYPIPLYLQEFINLTDESRLRFYKDNAVYCQKIIKDNFDINNINKKLEEIYELT